MIRQKLKKFRLRNTLQQASMIFGTQRTNLEKMGEIYSQMLLFSRKIEIPSTHTTSGTQWINVSLLRMEWQARPKKLDRTFERPHLCAIKMISFKYLAYYTLKAKESIQRVFSGKVT
jgi:hypothetical protein